MLCMVSTRYYVHAKNKNKIKIQHKGQVMALLKKSKSQPFFLLHIKATPRRITGQNNTPFILALKSLFNSLKERPC